MNQFKKIALVTISFALVMLGQQTLAHSAAIPDEQWNLPINAPDQDMAELLGFKIAGAATALNNPSFIAGDSKGQGNKMDTLLCTSDSDSVCSAAVTTHYASFLPPCDAQVTNNCVVGVSAISSDGREIPGQFSKFFPAKSPNDYPGNPARNLPVGSDPSVWTIPGVTHGGGADTYLLRFNVQGDARGLGTFNSNSVEVSLFPMTVKTGDYTLGKMTDANHPSDACLNDHFQCGGFGGQHGGNDQTLSAACVSFDIGFCALRQAFPENYKFKVQARLGNSPTGWFHGRFASPTIALNSNGEITNLTVDASPVKVPAVGAFVKQADMTPEMKTFYAKYPPGGAFGRLSKNGISNLLDTPSPSQSNVFEAYSVWSKIFNDKATATQSEWSFRTLELNGQDNSCFRDSTKLVGVVATNAMMYSGGAPTLNQAEGSLDYKVGAPHFDSSGSVFKGSYDLQLRSDVARCLYKFSSAPIKATVSIASDNGDSNVATTIVTEDAATGWMRMSASNFMFSNPTVKVKFSQDPVVVTNANPTSNGGSVTKPNNKLATITCTKGRVSKKFTAAKPVCPKGYVKK